MIEMGMSKTGRLLSELIDDERRFSDSDAPGDDEMFEFALDALSGAHGTEGGEYGIEPRINGGTDALLRQRGATYGCFSEGAAIIQALKQVAHAAPNWQSMTPAQREAVDMILHKLGRVLNGNPSYAENWADIAGYARLIERSLDPQHEEAS